MGRTRAAAVVALLLVCGALGTGAEHADGQRRLDARGSVRGAASRGPGGQQTIAMRIGTGSHDGSGVIGSGTPRTPEPAPVVVEIPEPAKEEAPEPAPEVPKAAEKPKTPEQPPKNMADVKPPPPGKEPSKFDGKHLEVEFKNQIFVPSPQLVAGFKLSCTHVYMHKFQVSCVGMRPGPTTIVHKHTNDEGHVEELKIPSVIVKFEGEPKALEALLALSPKNEFPPFGVGLQTFDSSNAACEGCGKVDAEAKKKLEDAKQAVEDAKEKEEEAKKQEEEAKKAAEDAKEAAGDAKEAAGDAEDGPDEPEKTVDEPEKTADEPEKEAADTPADGQQEADTPAEVEEATGEAPAAN